MIEFVSGPPDSEWGSVRANMGRAEPWELNYFAIGNEVSCAALELLSSSPVRPYWLCVNMASCASQHLLMLGNAFSYVCQRQCWWPA